MSGPVFNARRIRLALVLIGVIGLVLRWAMAYWTSGCNDMDAWLTFARATQSHDLCFVYANVDSQTSQFNHPPLMGLLAASLLTISARTGLPFYFVYKSAPVLADCVTTFILWLIFRQRGTAREPYAFAVYGLGLIAILISGYHGNTDALGVCCCLLAAWAMHQQRCFLSGLAFGAAMNVKLLPFLIIFPLLGHVRSYRKALHFIAGASLGLIPFLPILYRCVSVFLDKVVRYQPHIDHWGIPFLLILSKAKPSLALYSRGGTLILLGCVAAATIVCRLRRYGTVFTSCAIAFSLFLIFAPGFGVQYLLYVFPFLVTANLPVALAYGLSSGLFVGAIYLRYMRYELHFWSHLHGYFPVPIAYCGLGVWALLIFFVVWQLTRAVRAKPSPQRSARDSRSI